MKATILLVVILMIIWVIIWIISGFLKKRKDEVKAYDSKYNRVKYFIENSLVTSENFDICMRMLANLRSMKYKNREKTEVLSNEFYIKFQSERLRRLSEEEFAPEEIFRQN